MSAKNIFKPNEGDFGYLSLENNGTKFFFRFRSFVSYKNNGLPAVDATGQPTRQQQKIWLADYDGGMYKNLRSTALGIKAGEIRAKVIAWEQTTLNGQTVKGDGSVPAPQTKVVAPTNETTIADFFETVFLPDKRGLRDSGKLAAITVSDYEKIWNKFLKAHFNGTQTFKNYASWKGIAFLKNLRKKDGMSLYGEAVIRKIRSVASAIFAHAIELNYLDNNVPPKFNPWDAVKVKNLPTAEVSPDDEQGVAYTEDEVIRMIRNLELQLGDASKPLVEARDTNIRNAQVALALGFWAGLRPSETAALRWENVNVATGTLRVCESIVEGVAVKRTKNRINRVINYLEPLVVILREWHKQQGSPKAGLVIHKNGKHVSLRHLSDEIIQPSCKKAGLRFEGLYGCRRGCGTHMYLINVPVAKAAKFMGNTVDVYVKHYVVDKGEGSADVARIDRERRLEKAQQAQETEVAPAPALTEQKKLQSELAALSLGGGGAQ